LTQESYFAESEVSREQVGTRAAKLAADSPRRHVDTVHVPILMLHGDRDPQVDVDQSRAMAKALKGVNKPFEYIEVKGADHQMRHFEDRKTLLNAVEKFLSANMASQDIARPAP
jgi:dipeptidyl aminopeptidase/acylaminoacyl peptidase